MKRSSWLWLVGTMGLGAMGSGCVVETSCIDDDNDGICAISDCDDLDPAVAECVIGCIDDDADGLCWIDDCDDLDASIGSCDGCIDDFDCDGESDATDCYDDYNNAYVCVDVGCTPDDNVCTDDWYLLFCADDGFTYGSDCNEACTTDDRVYLEVCGGTPAASGECGADIGACVCWCEDSFDSCVNDYTVQYTRDSVTYQVDCKSYCGGTCDVANGACACP